MSESTRLLPRLGILVGVPLLVLLIAIVGGLIFWGEYTTQQTAKREFHIEMEFSKLAKILRSTNAAKEIVTMGGDSEFVSQHWTGAAIDASTEDIGRSLLQSVFSGNLELSVDLKGKLKIRTLDEYVGQNVITLEQNVQVRPDKIESVASLVEGSERLLGYELMTRFSRDGERSKVELELTQTIKTEAPWFAHRIADRRVHASAAKSLENQERATRQLIEENADKPQGLFPLLKGSGFGS